MPKTCCVPHCRSGYRGTVEKVSLFALPSDPECRNKWKRAIPRQETGTFSFSSPNVRVCDRHFDKQDIIREDECVIQGTLVRLPRDRAKLKADAIPRLFEGLPAYLSKKKLAPRQLPHRQPVKHPRESSYDSSGEILRICEWTALTNWMQ
uniref:THAP domain containing protein n=1 Tax=Rhipicephalus zambeziensis TaxID=60191 RepID=A0A224Z7Q2_9ACAR